MVHPAAPWSSQSTAGVRGTSKACCHYSLLFLFPKQLLQAQLAGLRHSEAHTPALPLWGYAWCPTPVTASPASSVKPCLDSFSMEAFLPGIPHHQETIHSALRCGPKDRTGFCPLLLFSASPGAQGNLGSGNVSSYMNSLWEKKAGKVQDNAGCRPRGQPPSSCEFTSGDPRCRAVWWGGHSTLESAQSMRVEGA